jgi:phosphatidylethanolamine/phosphatidyl-N-methylethanolamine N-methyltransferase
LSLNKIMSTSNLPNLWNKLRYTLYVPFYDAIARWFTPYRRQSIAQLNLQPGESVLLVGAGTGLDLEWLPADVLITATDITPAMVARINQWNQLLHKQVVATVMDGQALTFPDQSFDAVVLHLILAVIPDPVRCLLEAERVLKPGGKMAVFDKFLPPGQTAPLWRKTANILTRILATSINRHFEAIHAATTLKILSDSPVGLKGNLRVLLLEKPAD